MEAKTLKLDGKNVLNTILTVGEKEVLFKKNGKSKSKTFFVGKHSNGVYLTGINERYEESPKMKILLGAIEFIRAHKDLICKCNEGIKDMDKEMLSCVNKIMEYKKIPENETEAEKLYRESEIKKLVGEYKNAMIKRDGYVKHIRASKGVIEEITKKKNEIAQENEESIIKLRKEIIEGKKKVQEYKEWIEQKKWTGVDGEIKDREKLIEESGEEISKKIEKLRECLKIGKIVNEEWKVWVGSVLSF